MALKIRYSGRIPTGKALVFTVRVQPNLTIGTKARTWTFNAEITSPKTHLTRTAMTNLTLNITWKTRCSCSTTSTKTWASSLAAISVFRVKWLANSADPLINLTVIITAGSSRARLFLTSNRCNNSAILSTKSEKCTARCHKGRPSSR